MRALTVQQPWAWAIIAGGKDVENRTTCWKYRGPLAIHAGQRLSERGLASPLVQAARVRVVPANPADRSEDFAFGVIIGVVDLVEAHWDDQCDCDSPWAESSYVEAGGKHRDQIAHLVLERPRPLEVPIAARGALGLWTPDPATIALLEAA